CANAGWPMTIAWNASDRAAEETVIGAVLLHQDAFREAAAEIESGDDFYVRAHRHLWDAFANLDRDKEPIDSLTAWNRLCADGHAECFPDGPAHLARLEDAVVTFDNIGFHAKCVAHLAERRRWGAKLRELAVL